MCNISSFSTGTADNIPTRHMWKSAYMMCGHSQFHYFVQSLCVFFFPKKIHRTCDLRQSSDSFHDCLLALPLVLSAHLSGKTPANSNSLAATDPDKGVCTDPVVVQVLLWLTIPLWITCAKANQGEGYVILLMWKQRNALYPISPKCGNLSFRSMVTNYHVCLPLVLQPIYDIQ